MTISLQSLVSKTFDAADLPAALVAGNATFSGDVSSFDFLTINANNAQKSSALADAIKCQLYVFWYSFDPQGDFGVAPFVFTQVFNWGSWLLKGTGATYGDGNLICTIPVLSPYCAMFLLGTGTRGGTVTFNVFPGNSNWSRLGSPGSNYAGGYGSPLIPVSYGAVQDPGAGITIASGVTNEFMIQNQYVGEVQVNCVNFPQGAGFGSSIEINNYDVMQSKYLENLLRANPASIGATYLVYLRGMGAAIRIQNLSGAAATFYVSISPTGN